MGGTGGASLHGGPPALVTAEPSGRGPGLWGLSRGAGPSPDPGFPGGPWRPGWAVEARGPRPVQCLESESASIRALSLHIRRVGSVVGPPVGPDGSPGQEAQRTGSWGLALPTSACGLAPGHRGEGPVFPSPCPCRPSSLPIPSAGLSWGLTFPGRCFVSRGVGSSEGESTAWLPPP